MTYMFVEDREKNTPVVWCPETISSLVDFCPRLLLQVSPLVLDGHTCSNSVGVGEGSSLGHEQEYSDLASMLMDEGFDACKVWCFASRIPEVVAWAARFRSFLLLCFCFFVFRLS